MKLKRTVGSIRIIWTIAAKDISDAIKNKTSLGIIFTSLLLIVFFRFLLSLENSGTLPRLALYDSGFSQLTTQLENNTEFDLFVTTSQESMESYLGDKDIAVLGLVLPTDFEHLTVSEDEID